MLEQKEIKCPFCQEGIIKAYYRPSMRTIKTSRSAAGSKSISSIIKEKWTVLSDKCPKCGKTKGKMQKRMTDGESLSTSDAIKRAKESGLPLRF